MPAVLSDRFSSVLGGQRGAIGDDTVAAPRPSAKARGTYAELVDGLGHRAGMSRALALLRDHPLPRADVFGRPVGPPLLCDLAGDVARQLAADAEALWKPAGARFLEATGVRMRHAHTIVAAPSGKLHVWPAGASTHSSLHACLAAGATATLSCGRSVLPGAQKPWSHAPRGAWMAASDDGRRCRRCEQSAYSDSVGDERDERGEALLPDWLRDELWRELGRELLADVHAEPRLPDAHRRAQLTDVRMPEFLLRAAAELAYEGREVALQRALGADYRKLRDRMSAKHPQLGYPLLYPVLGEQGWMEHFRALLPAGRDGAPDREREAAARRALGARMRAAVDNGRAVAP